MILFSRRFVRALLFSTFFAICGGCTTMAPVGGDRYAPGHLSEQEQIEQSVILPKIMFLIDEKNLGTVATAEIEALAAEMWAKKNGQVVDQDMVRSNMKRDQTLLKSVGDSRGAAAIGLQYGADVIVVGEAVAKPSARRIAESNLRTYEAVVTLRALRTDTSETIASASKTASVVALEDVSGSSKALKAAGKESLNVLFPCIATKWCAVPGKQADVASVVSLTVGGVDQLSKVRKIREKLKSIAGISRVEQKSYTSGIALFDLVTSKPIEELSEDIVLEPPEGLKYQVLSVAQGKIDLCAVSAP